MKSSPPHDLDSAFGQALLTLRTAMGLTQTELTNLLGVSRRSLGSWETGSSYPKAEHLQHLIELCFQRGAFQTGHEAEEIRTLWRMARTKVLLDEAWLADLTKTSRPTVADAAQVANDKAKRPQTNNLPFQPTPFIGRDTELSEIARLLSDPVCRLLTLLGPGGAGKTRLSVEVAARQMGFFADGAVFVGLASVGTPNQIVAAIGEALNLSFAGHPEPMAYVLDYLRERQLLLVLDNFEHLLEGVGLVHEVLQHAPHVRILVTSRERLNLKAEWLFDVDGLAYPPRDARGGTAPHTLAQLTDYSAVQLFVQRAIQIFPGFAAPEATLKTIVQICQQVAGMPLAIELAAAGVRVMTVAKIEQQIRANMDSLATTLRDVPMRHRSMRAVFDHSWNLLSEPEQRLFSRLAVFRGGCTREAAEQVAEATLVALTALVDKSLLRQNTPTRRDQQKTPPKPRFVMLEPIREYALEKLGEHGEWEILQHKHAQYYLALAETCAAQWDSPTAESALEELDREHDNLRTALQWTLEGGDQIIGLSLGAALTRFWRSRTHLSEGRAWLEGLLALRGDWDDPFALSIRLRVMQGAAWIAADQNDFEHAELLFKQSLALDPNPQEAEAETSLLMSAGLQARSLGQYQRATTLLENALARQRAAGNTGQLSTGGIGHSLYLLALVMREQGDFARARALLEECVELHRRLNDREGMTQALLGLGDIARDQGDPSRIRQYCDEALATFREIGTQWAIGFSLNNLAVAAYLEGNLAQASAFIEECTTLFRAQKADASLAEVLITQAHILRAQGNRTAAYDILIEALRLAWPGRMLLPIASHLEGLAAAVNLPNQAVLAIRLLAAASALRSQMGTPVRPSDKSVVNQALADAQAVLSAEGWQAAWVEAEVLPLEQIVSTIPGAEAFTGLFTNEV